MKNWRQYTGVKTEHELADKTIPVNRNETCLGVARVPDQLNGIYITK